MADRETSQGIFPGLPEIVGVHIKDESDFLGQGGCGDYLLNMP